MVFKISQLSRLTETPQNESENDKFSFTQREKATSTLLAVGERVLYIANAFSVLSAFQPDEQDAETNSDAGIETGSTVIC